MSNENITAFNRPPYYDDFNQTDYNQKGLTTWTKDYQRLLFQPTYAVQTRELNTMQSMMQNQIAQLGFGLINPNFGAMVNGGASSMENAIYIDVKFDNPFTQTVENNFEKIKFFESRINGNATKIRSRVLSIKKKPNGDDDEYRIWFKYVNQEANTPITVDYQVNDILYITDYVEDQSNPGSFIWKNNIIPDDSGNEINIPSSPNVSSVPTVYRPPQNNPSNIKSLYGICRILQIKMPNGNLVNLPETNIPKAVGDGFVITCNEGVFLIKGTLVHTYPQTYYYVRTDGDEEFDGYLSFIINESIITSQDDSTLLDNANGTYNYAAPGADRYKLSIELALNTFDQDIIDLNEGFNPIFNALDPKYSSVSYINIREIKDGKILLSQGEISLSEKIDRYVQTRTYEESGNYTIRPFMCRVRELLNLKGRGGRYTLKQIFQNEFELVQSYYDNTLQDLRGWTKDNVNDNGIAIINADQNQPKLDNFIKWLDTKLIVDIDPTTCYVEGKRIELLNTQSVVIDKAREIVKTEEISITLPRGNYVEVVLDPTKFGSAVKNITNIIDLPSNNNNNKIKNILFQGAVTQAEIDRKLYPGQMSPGVSPMVDPSTYLTQGGITHLNYLKFRLYVYDNFDANDDSQLPTGFEYRYYPDSITGFPLQSLIRDNSIKNPKENRSVYNIGGVRAIKEITNVEYSKQVLLSGIDPNGVTLQRIVTFSSPESTVFASGLNLQDIIIYVVNDQKYINPFTEIESIEFPDPDPSDLSDDRTQLEIIFNSDTYNGKTVKIIVPVTVNDVGVEGKIYQGSKNKSSKNGDNYDTITVSCYTGLATLNNQDVILDTLKIYSDSNLSTQCSYKIVDTGVGDNFYDNPIVKINGCTNGVLGQTDTLYATYDYYDHTQSDYFIVNSYDGTPYGEIPKFGNSRISDFIDFRVKRVRTYDAVNDEYTYNKINTPAAVLPNSGAEFGLFHYTSRIDTVCVKSDGYIEVITGKPSLDPYPSRINANKPSLMPIYELRLNPYTYDPDDINQRYINNSRYTMHEISKLEKRISNLEYYSALSLLEKEAENRKILDLSAEGAGAERFKNGILVDAFVGHNIGNTSDLDYLCSVDTINLCMSPAFHVRNFRTRYTGRAQIGNGGFNRILTIDKSNVPTQEKHRKFGNILKESGSTFDGKTHFGIPKPLNGSNTVGPHPGWVGAEVISLWKGEREIMYENLLTSQTISVQPFEVAVWLGRVTLSPSSDEWIDTEWLPPHVVDLSSIEGALNDLADLGINAYGTNSTLIGTTLIGSSSSSTTSRIAEGHGGRNVTETVTRNTFRDSFRVEWYTKGFKDVVIDFGDRVVDTSVVPFIRSRDIQFKGYGFQPNTQVYVFFDGQNVTDYCYLTFPEDGDFVPFGHNDNPMTYNGETFDNWLNEPFLGSTISGPTEGDDILSTDEFGRIFGVFRIPNNWQKNIPSTNNRMSFPIGIRQFKIIDNPFNNELESDTYGSTTYNADGLRQDKQSSYAAVRIPTVEKQERIDTRVRVETSVNRVVGPYTDPVAQTFFVGEDYPNGVFLSDVDIFFATKTADPNVPVSVYVVPVENGIPQNVILPGSEKTLLSSDIPASQLTGRFITDGTEDDIDFGELVLNPITDKPTRFTFDYPVYLKPKNEYAVVVFSPSPDFRIWTSLLNKPDLSTNQVPNRNPAFGVFLQSQNKRTWTPDQYRDMTIRLHKAVFPVGETTEFKFSTLIPNNGFDYQQELAGAVAGNNQGISHIDGAGNIRFDHTFIQPLYKVLQLPGTDVDLEINYFSAAGAKLNKSSFGVVENLQEIYLREQIPSRNILNDRVNHVEVDIRLTTFDRNISPVVDCETGSIYCRQNEVNNSTVGEGSEFRIDNSDNNIYKWLPSSTTPGGLFYNGGEAVARYITKNVKLNNASEDLRVNLAVNRPSLNCNIHVYAKRKIPSVYEKSMFEEIPWYKMEVLSVSGNTNISTLPINSGTDDYTEIEYILPSPDPNKTIYDDSLLDTSIGYKLKGQFEFSAEYVFKDIISYQGVLYMLNNNTYTTDDPYLYNTINNINKLPGGSESPWAPYISPGFNEFAIKVVFTTSDKAQVCKIKNLTAVASI